MHPPAGYSTCVRDLLTKALVGLPSMAGAASAQPLSQAPWPQQVASHQGAGSG